MRCPGCQGECASSASRCAACGTPLLLVDDPAPALLDRAVDMDRRFRRHPPAMVLAEAEPAVAACPAEPRLRSRTPLWDLGSEPELEAEPGAAALPVADSPTGWQLGELLDPAELARLELGFEALPATEARAADVFDPSQFAGAAIAAEREPLRENAISAWGEPPGDGAAPAAPEPFAAAAISPGGEPDREPLLADPVATSTTAGAAPARRRERAEAAPRRRRLAAAAVDLLAVGAAALPALAVTLHAAPDRVALRVPVAAACAALLALLGFTYHALGPALMGATLGQRLLGLRVIGRDGERPGPGRSAARAALAVVGTAALGAGPAVGLFTNGSRPLHDLALGTRVVSAR